MNKLHRIVSLALVAVSLGVISLGSITSAATVSNGGNGLRVSPVRKDDLTIKPGSTQTVVVTVTNVTSSTASLQAIINDFTALAGNETGQPNLILDANQYAPSHSLKRLVAPIPNFSLAAGQSTNIKVNISVPANTPGGGYYGAVRFAPSSTNSDKNVTLSASVGTLILVKVPGNIREQLSITSFDVRHGDPNEAKGGSSFFTTNRSLNGVIRFQNSGDVQEQPFGKVVLKKGGKILQTSEINNVDPRGNVLPDSIRRFSVPLTKVGSLGKYTIEGNFGYGSNGQLLSATSTFYVVPILTIVIVLLVVALLAFLIFGLPRVIKSYNKRILRNARR
ncbi:MAG: DUF916 domain-containing protein [Candidatus Saccharimonadales bacterium]